MRIAQVSPLFEAVPPKLYGGTERVVYSLTEELVAMGHDVTLFASGDSVTSAKLAPMRDVALRLDPTVRDWVATYYQMVEMIYRRKDEFDVLHFHIDYFPLSLFGRQNVPYLTTVHGRLDVKEFVDVYGTFPDAPMVSISNSQRRPIPNLNWVRTILHGMPRGMLRALALRHYLFARAARGRNLRFAWPPRVARLPHHRPPAEPAPRPRPAPLHPRRPDPALLDPGDPDASRLPTQEELAAEVRRRPVGRTIAYICMDLGIAPGLCDGDFWNRVEKTLRRYGGSLRRLYQVRARREETFQRERDRRSDTWHIDWRDMRPPTVRRALGCLIGETPPAIVPS